MFRFTRPLRRRVASLMVLVMLVVQMATAAYACTVLLAGASDAAAMAAMPGCVESASAPNGMTDADQPGLCLAHCNGGAAAFSDQGGNGALQLSGLAAMPYIAWAFFFGVPLRGRRPPHAPKTERATPPPLSILHCCYRV